MSAECREKLAQVRPTTVSVWVWLDCVWVVTVRNATFVSAQLGAASRIPGVTPAALLLLMSFVKRSEDFQS